MYILGLIFYYIIGYCDSYIIPNEVPTILSVIYSNIPPIKVGIDTRLGYGFRLGPHAEYQFLVEIGPQTNTNPLSTNGTETNNQYFALNRIQLFNDAQERVNRRNAKRQSMRRKKKSQGPRVETAESKKKSIETAENLKKSQSNQKKTDSESPTKISLL